MQTDLSTDQKRIKKVKQKVYNKARDKNKLPLPFHLASDK